LTKSESMWLRSGRLVLVPVLSITLLNPTALAATSSSTSIISDKAIQIGESAVGGAEAGVKPDPSNAKVSKEEAIAKLKELFPRLEKAEVDRVELGVSNVYPPPANQMIWSIHWSYRMGNSSYGFSSQSDAMTGDLVSMHLHFPVDEEEEAYYPPKVSKEEALTIGKSFAVKAAPSIPMDQLEEQSSTYVQNQSLFGPVRYDFNFARKIDGIPATNNQVHMTVDGNGEVVGFHRSTSAVTEFPSSEVKVTLEEAQEQYRNNISLTLQYVPVRRGGPSSDWFLGWKPESPLFTTIDAVTGEFLTQAGEPVNESQDAFREVPASEQGWQPRTNQSQPLTADEAVAAIEQVTDIPAEKTLQHSSLGNYRGAGEQNVWQLVWRESDQGYYGPEGETFASVDSNTGQILEYREDRFPRPGSPSKTDSESGITINEQEAESIAIELIQRMYPDAAKELKWTKRNPNAPVGPNDEGFAFHFQRFYEGRLVEGDTVHLTLNNSGLLTSYYVNRTENLQGKLQGLTPAITEEEATAKYKEGTDVELQYRQFGGIMTTDGYEKPTVKLVYQQMYKNGMNPGYAIDATSGQWKTSWMQEQQKETVIDPVDMKGHWAEQELKTMIQYQLLQPDENGNIQPNQGMKRGDWLTMAVKAVDPYYVNYYSHNEKAHFEDVSEESPYFAAVHRALDRKWLNTKEKNLRLGDALTREELAVMLTRIVKYEELSKYYQEDQGVLEYSDAGAIREKGAVAIVEKLGLMRGSNGEFKPNQKVTRAEAATVLMRLVYLQGKIDQSIMR
jgi:hypothetical protein